MWGHCRATHVPVATVQTDSVLYFWLTGTYRVNLFERIILGCLYIRRLPLWSSGQSSWLQIEKSRVRFQALPDFVRNSGSGTGPLNLVRITGEALKRGISGSGLENED
jgi:hypothetical protein